MEPATALMRPWTELNPTGISPTTRPAFTQIPVLPLSGQTPSL